MTVCMQIHVSAYMYIDVHICIYICERAYLYMIPFYYRTFFQVFPNTKTILKKTVM